MSQPQQGEGRGQVWRQRLGGALPENKLFPNPRASRASQSALGENRQKSGLSVAGIRLQAGVGKGQEKLGPSGGRGLDVAPASAADSPWTSDKGIGFHAPGAPSSRAGAEPGRHQRPLETAPHLPRPPSASAHYPRPSPAGRGQASWHGHPRVCVNGWDLPGRWPRRSGPGCENALTPRRSQAGQQA